MSTLLAPLLILVAVVAVDGWVYLDARAFTERGTPVVLSIGAFVVDSPETWLLCCVVLFVIFFPAYVVARRR